MKKLLLTLLALLGLTQAAAQENEYLPLVREGVKWVYSSIDPFKGKEYDGDFIRYGIQYFTLEIKGDTIIDGKEYKPVHLYSGQSINENNDTVPVYLREEGKVVYGIIPDDRRYRECPIGIGTMLDGDQLFSDEKTGAEFILYDFNDPVSFYESLDNPFFYGRLHYDHAEIIQAGIHKTKKHIFKCVDDYGNGFGNEYIIEGIGFIGESPGMTVNYFYGVTTGVTQVVNHLSHIIENDEIFYKTEWYGESDAIDEVAADQQGQQDGNYYDLMGRAVGQDVPTMPGIYIHNGKKIVVR